MEKYRLGWTPGTGASQELHINVAGQAESVQSVPDMTTAAADVDFQTDASVSWFVRTFNTAKDQSVDSDPSVFVASDQTPPSQVTKATNLNVTWLSHTP